MRMPALGLDDLSSRPLSDGCSVFACWHLLSLRELTSSAAEYVHKACLSDGWSHYRGLALRTVALLPLALRREINVALRTELAAFTASGAGAAGMYLPEVIRGIAEASVPDMEAGTTEIIDLLARRPSHAASTPLTHLTAVAALRRLGISASEARNLPPSLSSFLRPEASSRQTAFARPTNLCEPRSASPAWTGWPADPMRWISPTDFRAWTIEAFPLSSGIGIQISMPDNRRLVVEEGSRLLGIEYEDLRSLGHGKHWACVDTDPDHEHIIPASSAQEVEFELDYAGVEPALLKLISAMSQPTHSEWISSLPSRTANTIRDYVKSLVAEGTVERLDDIGLYLGGNLSRPALDEFLRWASSDDS